MPMLIALTVYDLEEVCEELAKRTGWYKKYSRQRIHKLIEKYLPVTKVEKIGKRYFITEAELKFLAIKMQLKKRPKKPETINKFQ